MTEEQKDAIVQELRENNIDAIVRINARTNREEFELFNSGGRFNRYFSLKESGIIGFYGCSYRTMRSWIDNNMPSVLAQWDGWKIYRQDREDPNGENAIWFNLRNDDLPENWYESADTRGSVISVVSSVYNWLNDNNVFNDTFSAANYNIPEEVAYGARTMNNMTELEVKIRELLKANHQIILTGAPGTGKTYLAKEIACSLTGHQNWSEAVTSGHVKFCQFHPSYSYADFVEGLRPVQDSATGNVGFVRKDGAFKSFCKRALRKCTGNFESAYKKLCDELDEKHSSDNPLELRGERENRYGVSLNSRGNLTLHTGTDLKAHGVLTADKLRMYHENTPPEDRSWEGYFRGVLSYLGRRFGLTEDTPDQEDQKFVFVIDEINRGDLSKIFGELFFSIDPGYRGKAGLTDTQYQNMVSQGDEYENGFYVPENVYIIGTMNDIDRSVESMDFAIRRRFTWYEVTADARKDMLNDIQDDDLRKKAMARMQNINKLIAAADSDLELGAAYQIGPAYFLKLKDMSGDNKEKFDTLWKLHIEPLLKEYLRGQTEISEKIEKLKEAYNNDNSQRQQAVAQNEVAQQTSDAEGAAAVDHAANG